jgi:lipoprotein-releasing system permease protein
MDQMDDFVVFCSDVKHLQMLQDWNSDQVAGFEVFLRRFEDIQRFDELIYQNIGYELNTIKIEDKYPEIFAWLRLLDTNVWVVLIFAVLVSMVNMISTLTYYHFR